MEKGERKRKDEGGGGGKHFPQNSLPLQEGAVRSTSQSRISNIFAALRGRSTKHTTQGHASHAGRPQAPIVIHGPLGGDEEYYACDVQHQEDRQPIERRRGSVSCSSSFFSCSKCRHFAGVGYCSLEPIGPQAFSPVTFG